MESVVCSDCGSKDVLLAKHRFKNDTYHLKCLCKVCFHSRHVPTILMGLSNIDYTNELGREFRQNRNALRKAKRREKKIAELALKPVSINKTVGPKESKKCLVCEKPFILDPNNGAHQKGLCKNKHRSKIKKKKIKRKTIRISKDFYETKEWQDLRYRTLKKHGRKCMVCFRTNLELHVDHIKPISKFPELALDPNNLQVLCRDCNLGKGNKDCIDWRPNENMV